MTANSPSGTPGEPGLTTGAPRPVPHRTALGLLAAAATVGVLGDSLLRGSPWGINLVLWLGTVVGLAGVLLWRRDRALPAGSVAALAAVVVFAAGFVWRDAEFLRSWDFLAVVATLSLLMMRAGGKRLTVSGLSEYTAGAGDTAVNVAVGAPILLTGEVEWTGLVGTGARRRAGAVAVGVLLSVLLALVFGGLLREADPVFARIVDATIAWDFGTVLSHLLLAGGLAWIGGGYLRGLHAATSSPARHHLIPAPPALGLLQLGIPLGTLILLFGTFIAIQLGYLFGGEAMILEAGWTYAEYARRGFFELIAVTTLALPTLLGAWWVLDRRRRTSVRWFRILAWVVLVLLALVVASALVRMRLYVNAYGLTEDRLYGTAFILWVGFVLAWFGATMQRGDDRRFAFGAVASGLAMLAALNVLNPDALIARTNLRRAAAGMELDVAYLNRLSADAIPTLMAAWPQLDEHGRCALARELLVREGTLAVHGSDQETGVTTLVRNRTSTDWRTWNVSRWRARRAVRTRRIADPALVCRAPPTAPQTANVSRLPLPRPRAAPSA